MGERWGESGVSCRVEGTWDSMNPNALMMPHAKGSERKSSGNNTCSGLSNGVTVSTVLRNLIRKTIGKTGRDKFVRFQVRNQLCEVSLAFVDRKLQGKHLEREISTSEEGNKVREFPERHFE